MSKPTPTPWTTGKRRRDNINGGEFIELKTADNRIWVGDIRESKDARFIVRAVNSHEKLVDVARNLVAISDEWEAGVSTIDRALILAEQARAALAKARGGNDE